MLKNGDPIKFLRQKDYEVLNPNLGKGSFGKTIIVRDNLINEVFVCKKYDPDDADEKNKFYETFVNEIKIMHKLYHENIVRIYNYYLYPELYTGYILMEFIEGKNIGDYLADNQFQIFADIDFIFVQLIDAFSYLEKNTIIHRDIREQNILVTESNVVKIIDFGLGKIIHKIDNNTDTFNSIINRNGMELVPEEFEKGFYDSKTDMFCIAELFNRLVKKNNIAGFKYSKILQKMMSISRKNRYSSFKDIRDEINTKKLTALNISDNDKLIYQKFTNYLKSAISIFINDPKFVFDVDQITNGLKSLITLNLLEEEIQRNDTFIGIFVASRYRYFPKVKIPTSDLKNFFNWFSELDKNNKILIVENITHKLTNIKIQKEEDELPF